MYVWVDQNQVADNASKHFMKSKCVNRHNMLSNLQVHLQEVMEKKEEISFISLTLDSIEYIFFN